MCGIVGLHLKSAARERDLGALLAPMIGCMATRGAESAGLAFFSDPVPAGQYRYSVRLAPERIDDAAQQAQDLVKELAVALDQEVVCERAGPSRQVTGIEAEYTLVRRCDDGSIEVADPLDRSEKPCYEAKGLSRMWDHLAEISDYINELGWGNYANDHEDGQGQFEQNFEFDDAMVTADRTVFFRIHGAHDLAQARDGRHLHAQAVPTPHRQWSPHTHEPVGRREGAVRRRRGSARSRAQHHGLPVLGGAAATRSSHVVPDRPDGELLQATGCDGPDVRGHTWAPGYVSYGGDNRTVMLRVLGGHIEHRGVCGSANPYLAFTALLAAGLDGIERQLDPGDPIRENLFDKSDEEINALGVTRFPGTLLDAVRELPDDDILRSALGKVRDGDYIDYLAHVREAEFRDYHADVSAWEINRYLTLF